MILYASKLTYNTCLFYFKKHTFEKPKAQNAKKLRNM